MPLKAFLLNEIFGRKCRLNGVWPSNRLPNKSHLRQSFSDRVVYSPEELPPKTDLRNDMTSVENQSSIGSCSANALAGAYEYLTKKKHGEQIDVSRLFIYYNGRAKENSSGSVTDSGCSMTSAIEALEEFGTCVESIWPYDVSRVNTRPNNQAYQEAKPHTISEALQVKVDLYEMKSCLAQGFPFVFGLRLFTSFDKAATGGVVPMPSSSDRSRQSDGSHALVAVGYSDQSQSFIVRNSWGEDWGDRGYCYIPYDYLSDPDLCFDSWTIRKVSGDDIGQDHWDYNDDTDYQSNANNYGDDDSNGTIQHFDEDDFGGMNFGGGADGGFNRGRNDQQWNQDDNNFGFNDRANDDQGWNQNDNSGYNDRGNYDQQWNQDNNSGYNDRGNFDQGWNQGDNSGYNDRGDYGQQWNQDNQSGSHHKHHGHHHHRN
ncbi:unnamed protein product [Adineta steineri]|uniref:Peptidase C1A papain C-terminal domain-containing protein n=1 Tax=Adineta steineri TaxID=433720 RepID=A0A818W766_9BILA|nr:unnamed protein product [Adineta steineri]